MFKYMFTLDTHINEDGYTIPAIDTCYKIDHDVYVTSYLSANLMDENEKDITEEVYNVGRIYNMMNIRNRMNNNQYSGVYCINMDDDIGDDYREFIDIYIKSLYDISPKYLNDKLKEMKL